MYFYITETRTDTVICPLKLPLVLTKKDFINHFYNDEIRHSQSLGRSNIRCSSTEHSLLTMMLDI